VLGLQEVSIGRPCTGRGEALAQEIGERGKGAAHGEEGKRISNRSELGKKNGGADLVAGESENYEGGWGGKYPLKKKKKLEIAQSSGRRKGIFLPRKERW